MLVILLPNQQVQREAEKKCCDSLGPSTIHCNGIFLFTIKQLLFSVYLGDKFSYGLGQYEY